MLPVANSLRDIVLTLNANQQQQQGGTGDTLYLAPGSAAIIAETSNGDRVDLVAGRAAKFPNPYTWVNFINPGGAQIQVTVFYGFGDITDSNITGNVGINGGAGGIQDTVDVPLNNGATTPVLPVNANRRTAIITNIGTANIRVGGTGVAANKGTLLQPGQSLSLDTQGAINAWATAAGQSVSVSEVLI